jgi:N-acetylglucosaminyldiphosphoundecaprenol N-acetyl-beta-D-mannosaminyltransferase
MRVTGLFDLPFITESSIDQLATLIVREGEHRDGVESSWRTVVTPNVDHLVHYRNHPDDQQVAQSAALVLPDGAPIVWASRLLRAPLSARLAGSDLFTAWWQEVRTRQRPVVILATSEELAAHLRLEHPTAHCIVAPIFDGSDEHAITAVAGEIIAAVEVHQPDAIVIGLPMVKSHRVVRAIQRTTPPAGQAPWLLMLGASAEFHAGLQQRAPEWMQRSGLEWLFRLLSDPRRLAKRYLVDDMAFFPLVWREWRRCRAQESGVDG